MKSNIEFLYEELRKATDGGSESMTHDDALKQIEYWQGGYERETALQARVVELDHDTADLAMLADQYKAERDAAQARVKELETEYDEYRFEQTLKRLGDDSNAGEVVGFTDEYVLVEFPCEGNTVNIEAGMLLYPHPVIAAGAQAQQPLSEEQIELIWEARRPAWSEAVARFHFARAIEAAHKIGGSV